MNLQFQVGVVLESNYSMQGEITWDTEKQADRQKINPIQDCCTRFLLRGGGTFLCHKPHLCIYATKHIA